MELTSSLAGTGKTYIVGQARVRGGCLHVQVPGPVGNRGYGATFDIPVDEIDPKVLAWIEGHPATLDSLAGTGAQYVRVQMSPRDKSINFQMDCKTGNLNRPYGAAFEWTPSEVPTNLMDWLRCAVEEDDC